jgi:transcriptional regulator with XRE-family HTH domain
MNNFSDRLKQLRMERGYTLRDLALKCDISKSALGMYERDERQPKIETVEQLADVFNVDIDYLLGKTDVRNQIASSLGVSSLEEVYDLIISPAEQLLLDLFRQIPEEKQQLFLQMGRLYADSLKID